MTATTTFELPVWVSQASGASMSWSPTGSCRPQSRSKSGSFGMPVSVVQVVRLGEVDARVALERGDGRLHRRAAAEADERQARLAEGADGVGAARRQGPRPARGGDAGAELDDDLAGDERSVLAAVELAVTGKGARARARRAHEQRNERRKERKPHEGRPHRIDLASRRDKTEGVGANSPFRGARSRCGRRAPSRSRARRGSSPPAPRSGRSRDRGRDRGSRS